MPPIDSHPPNGLSVRDTIAWAVRAWSQDYPEYLSLYLEGGVLFGGPHREPSRRTEGLAARPEPGTLMGVKR